MTDEERAGLEKTLKILHLLADLGVIEQVLGVDGQIRWRAAKGSKRRFNAIMKALRLR